MLKTHLLIGLMLGMLPFSLSHGLEASTSAGTEAQWRIESENLGPMGTGSKFFRCGLSHSSGVVYIGTYGPEPAIIWKYDPKSGKLLKVAEPGEYQLDCMVEAPNGIVYIGTAYNGLVYRLDPVTDTVTSLGSPPIDSTNWIFTMVCTQKGEIYGAKGVGLFKLNWETDTFEVIGVVPGNHETPGPCASSPITRILEEDQDGVIWGDTNRWLFRFDPASKRIEPLVDMALIDEACYALFLPGVRRPTKDLYFCLHSRYSGKEVRNVLYAYRADKASAEAVDVPGLEGPVGPPTWWESDGGPRLLIPKWRDEEPGLLIVDPVSRKIEGRFHRQGDTQAGYGYVPGPGLHFLGFSGLLKADVAQKELKLLAANPVPVDCRCLAISKQRALGTDTYDCGHAFTLDVATRKSTDHGKVWADDHRCNYGPATFAGPGDRYLVANHSQLLQALWVTDTQTRRHWKIGEPASQLQTFSDGNVWGVAGPNPNTLTFDDKSWRSAFQTISGPAFRYEPGSESVQVLKNLGDVGPLVEAPGDNGCALAVKGLELCLYDAKTDRVLQNILLPSSVIAAATDRSRSVTHILCEGGILYACHPADTDGLVLSRVADSFGLSQRGFFVLARSSRVIGLAEDGTASVYDPKTHAVTHVAGPVPLPAGPALDPEEDAWYFASDQVARYTLATRKR
jgi:hypothetical protein